MEGIGWIPFEPTPGYEEIRNVTWESKGQKESWKIEPELPMKETEGENGLSDIPVLQEQKEEMAYTGRRKLCLTLACLGVILLLGGLLLIIDFLLERHRDRKRTVEKKFCILVSVNLQILSMLGIKRAKEETFYELAQRAEKFFRDKSCSPVSFLGQYEKYLYGKEKPGVKELATLQRERQQLLSALKEQKGRLYPFYGLRLLLYKGNT